MDENNDYVMDSGQENIDPNQELNDLSDNDDSQFNVSSESEEAQKQEKRIRKKKSSSERRVNELLYERSILAQENSYKDQLILEQNQRMEELNNKLFHKENQSQTWLQAAYEEKEESLLKSLKQAKEEGDIDSEVYLIDQLSDLKAEKNLTLSEKKREQEKEIYNQKRYQEESYEPLETFIPNSYEEPYSEENEVFEEWVEENKWYANNPRLKQEADAYLEQLANALSLRNEEDAIGSPEFYRIVSNEIKKKYGVNHSKDSRQKTTQSHQHVAPVSGEGTTMAEYYVNNQFHNGGVSPYKALTPEEYSLVRHMQPMKPGQTEADMVSAYLKAKKSMKKTSNIF